MRYNGFGLNRIGFVFSYKVHCRVFRCCGDYKMMKNIVCKMIGVGRGFNHEGVFLYVFLFFPLLFFHFSCLFSLKMVNKSLPVCVCVQIQICVCVDMYTYTITLGSTLFSCFYLNYVCYLFAVRWLKCTEEARYFCSSVLLL